MGAVPNISVIPSPQSNSIESFCKAETPKVFYLMFSTSAVANLDNDTIYIYSKTSDNIPSYTKSLPTSNAIRTFHARTALHSSITSNDHKYSLMSSIFSSRLPSGRYLAAASRTLCDAGGGELESVCTAEALFLLTCLNSRSRASTVSLSCS